MGPVSDSIGFAYMTLQPSRSSRFKLLLILATIAALVGCVTTAPKPEQARKESVFYPLPPDPPRIQYLATFASARDLGAARNALADFVAGDESEGQELQRPYGTSMYKGRIYVADNRLNGLAVFDLPAKKFSVVSGSGAGRMQRPINVTIDADGSKYVTDTGRNQVLVFDRDDRFVSALGTKTEFKPVDTAIAGASLYLVDIEHHEVQVLDKVSGKLKFKFGGPGAAPGNLFQPTNLAIGPNGDVYVVETGGFRVSRFTPEGKFVRSYGEAGQGPGQFARPKGIAIDRAGRMYVGDAAFQNVQIFDATGRVLMSFGQPKEGAGGALNLPAGIAIDYDDVALFQRYADPGFALEYVVLVVSQFGPNKVDVFGFGKMRGVQYPPDSEPETKTAR